MKQTLLTAATLLSINTFAQTNTTDTTKAIQPDTLKVGNFIIIKNKDGKSSSTIDKKDKTFTINIGESKRNNKSNVSTNWWILDLGFANLRDETNYSTFRTQAPGFYPTVGRATAVTENSFQLRNGKSSNVNIWVFMQKLNIAKHKLNLKYGLGLEMYNYRYDSRISYRRDPSTFVFNDTISFSKNKLYAGYATIPVMLNFQANPDKRNSFSASVGVSAGYLIASRNKQVSSERGKEKYRGDLNLEPWRLAAIAELGLGPVRLYGSYSFNSLHKTDRTGLEQYPYTIGIRFSNW